MAAKVTAPDAELSLRQVLPLLISNVSAMIVAALDQTCFGTALPTIVGELHGVSAMKWVTTSYILASMLMVPVYSVLSNRYNRKHVIVSALLIFMAGSLIGAMAHTMTVLIIGRFIQGVGGGGLMMLAQSTIGAVIPSRQRGKFQGVLVGAFMVPMIMGPILGGWLTAIGWRWLFWMNLVIGIPAVILAVMFTPALTHLLTRKKIDYLGIAALSIVSTSIVLIASWGGSTYAWGSRMILLLIVIAVAATVAFVMFESEAESPVMPGVLFKDRNFVIATVAVLVTSLAMLGAVSYLPTYMQMVTGYSPTKSGYLMLPMMLGMVGASRMVGKYMHKHGKYAWFPPIGMALVAYAILLLTFSRAGMPIWKICACLTVMGVGLGMNLSPLNLVVQNQFPVKLLATATAAYMYFRQLGSTLGAALVGNIFTGNLTSLLSTRVPNASSASPGGIESLSPELVRSLPAPIRDGIISSYNDALIPVFHLIWPLALITGVMLLFLWEKPLADAHDADEMVAEPA